MYIENKYWNHYIGESDDSLTLVEYLAGKEKKEIQVGEIFADFGVEKLQGEFKNPELSLVFTDEEGWEMDIRYAIDLITDLAALLLECKVNETVDLCELFEEAETSVPQIRIIADSKEHDLIHKVLTEFVSDPLAFDLSGMCSEEEMLEMAEICGELKQELYG